jgi:hypothetical protein
MSLCIRRSLHLPNLIRTSFLQYRRYSDFTPPESTYYVQSFPRSKEQYLLLLPRTSLPLGLIHIPNLPGEDSFPTAGPVTTFLHPVSASLLQDHFHTFIENGGFRTLFQKVVAENIDKEEMVVNEAQALVSAGGEGWIHLCDERQLPSFGRIPETEDIIGSVFCKDGVVKKETYEPCLTYRFITSTAGPMKLSPFLLGRLRERLTLPT